jgi:hypothetical protein
MIALIPLFFAIQQFAEGAVWLQINGEFQPVSQLGQTAPYIYLLFAWVIWPVFTPIALLLPEKVRWKQIVCFLSLLAGLSISIGDIRYMLTHDIAIKIVGHSISYGEAIFSEEILYLLAVLPPVLLSSIKKMWLFGLFVLVSFIFSNIIYTATFTSVWCFFAAGISLALYEVLCVANTPSSTQLD